MHIQQKKVIYATANLRSLNVNNNLVHCLLITLILDLQDFLCRLRHTYLRNNKDMSVVIAVVCSCRSVSVLLINNNFHGLHVCILVDSCAGNSVCNHA
jgi:hypothetical protein